MGVGRGTSYMGELVLNAFIEYLLKKSVVRDNENSRQEHLIDSLTTDSTTDVTSYNDTSNDAKPD